MLSKFMWLVRKAITFTRIEERREGFFAIPNMWVNLRLEKD